MAAQLVAVGGNEPRACRRGLGRRSGRVWRPLGQRSFQQRGARSARRRRSPRRSGIRRSGPRRSIRAPRAVGGPAGRRRCPLGRRPLRRRSRFRRSRPPLIARQVSGEKLHRERGRFGSGGGSEPTLDRATSSMLQHDTLPRSPISRAPCRVLRPRRSDRMCA